MTKMHVSVTDQVLKVTEAPVIASGGVQEISVVFDFCSLWDGYAKTVVFYLDADNKHYMLVDENDTCSVPQEVYEEKGTFHFGVFGVKGDSRRTSTVAKCKVRDGAITGDMAPADPTLDIYDQLLAETSEAVAIAQSVRDDADEIFASAEEATAEANESASKANTVTARANVAAASAEQATALANTATENANTATAHATAEAEKATQATVAALNATEATNEAREAFLANAGAALEEITAIVQDGEDAPPIVCSANGEFISVKDSAKRMLRGLTLFGKTEQVKTTGKNLLKYTENIGKNAGVTFSVNSDGSISASGTPSAIFAESIYGDYSTPIAFPAGNYIISGGVDKDHYLRVRIHNPDGTFKVHIYATETEKQFTIEDGELVSVSIYFATLTAVNGMTFYPMIRLASVSDATYEPYTGGKASPSPDYPQELESVGASGAIHTTVVGKNLMAPYNVYVDDGRHNIFCYQDNGLWLPAGTYTIHMNTVCTALCVRPYGSSQNLHVKYATKSLTFTLSEAARVHFLFYNETAIAAGAENTIQLEVGSIATEFAPHKVKQSITIQTPNGQPGIPVSSGGNYTDGNGQQWVCDEIDFGRGMYVQNCKQYSLLGYVSKCTKQDNTSYSSDILRFDFINTFGAKATSTIICNRFVNNFIHNSPQLDRIKECVSTHPKEDRLSVLIDKSRLATADLAGFTAYLENNETIILCQLATPIETPLSAEELASYAALHSNKPNTTVYNDAGAGLAVEYVADTKTYIDNKFAELASAIVNNA